MEEIQQPPITVDLDSTQRSRTKIELKSVTRVANIVVAAATIVSTFWWLQFSTASICCGDFDGYYHIRWSRMLWESMRAKHFPPVFKWLPLTTLNSHDYVDHHLLFHIILIPFTWFHDLRMGAKVAAIVFASLAVFSCYWLIVRYRIRYSLVWVIALLACSSPFLYRLNMTKAPPLTIIYLVIAIYLLFEKRFWPLLPLAFVFALTYDLFVLLALAAFIWTAVIGWTEQRFEWRPLVWVGLGCALGLVVNPYFPRNMHLLYEHARIKITSGDFNTKVGQEWYPYDTYEFVGNCLVALIAMLVGYVTFDPRDREGSKRPLFFLIFSTALMLMTMRWKRFAEYFPPFAILFAAFALQQFWTPRSIFSRLPDDVMSELQPYMDRGEAEQVLTERKRLKTWELATAWSVGLILFALTFAPWEFISPKLKGVASARRTAKDISESDPRDYYAKGTAWMRANIPPGELVFNTDWDDFPRLFYYDPTHVYTSGLDPSYLFDKNPDLSRLYDRITTGDQDDPGPLIRDRFGARWVFSDNTKDHDGFFDQALRSGWFDRVYEDEDCSVLHIRDEKGEPPPEMKNDDSDTGDDDNGQDNAP
jgi:hypothetical protein